MTEHTPPILCAVRGGKESRATVTRAIDIALEQDARLVFFHVTDAEFLGQSAMGGPLSVMYKELREMSEFAMLVLCDRARRRGVENVDYVQRDGSIRKQLRLAAEETHARIMVMGRPIRSPGTNVFRAKDFEKFVKMLENVGDLQVVQVAPDES